MLICLLIFAAWVAVRHAFSSLPEMVLRTDSGASPTLELLGEANEVEASFSVQSVRCWPFLLVIKAQDESGAHRRWVIGRDMLPAARFRRLSVLLRTAHYGTVDDRR